MDDGSVQSKLLPERAVKPQASIQPLFMRLALFYVFLHLSNILLLFYYRCRSRLFKQFFKRRVLTLLCTVCCLIKYPTDHLLFCYGLYLKTPWIKLKLADNVDVVLVLLALWDSMSRLPEKEGEKRTQRQINVDSTLSVWCVPVILIIFSSMSIREWIAIYRKKITSINFEFGFLNFTIYNKSAILLNASSSLDS